MIIYKTKILHILIFSFIRLFFKLISQRNLLDFFKLKNIYIFKIQFLTFKLFEMTHVNHYKFVKLMIII